MKFSVSKVLKTIAPLGIGIFLIWYSLGDLSNDERQLLWEQIQSANPYWLLLSVFIGILSHISRAYRWKYLLEPLGCYPRLDVSFSAIMIGYVANLGIPRSGEILRPVTLSNYENIVPQKAIGTVITERLIDVVMLLIVMFITFLFNTDLLLSYLEEQQIKPLKMVYSLLFMTFVLAVGFYVLKKIEFSFLDKIKRFINEIYEGILSVFSMKNKAVFIFHTFFIWSAYVFMLFVVKYSIPETANLSFSAILMAFMAGSFAMSATNGGLGAYPIAIGLAITLFGIDKSYGEAYGWIMWTSQTLLNIIVGGLCFLYLSLFLKKK